MKSSAKFKFLFIALSYWRLAVESVGVWDPKLKAREALLDTLVGPNFLRVLVKNVSNTKAQLHDEANSVKSALVTFLQVSELSSGTCLRLLTQLFGPNTTTRLSVKKHVDLVKVLSGRITQEAEVRQYFGLMKAMFDSPQADEVFGEVV